MKYLVLLTVLVLSISACKKKKTVDQPSVDNQIITSYITTHSLTAKATGDGLYYVITTQGTGVQPSSSSSVTVSYKGYFTNGNVFDQSTSFSTSLSNVIKGWTEGIPYFKKGSSGKLLIPSALGYGDQESGSIPANSVLIFDISLLDVH
jgi:FKBP-type peptidyl-prolyl cis-trans isomerase FkpA